MHRSCQTPPAGRELLSVRQLLAAQHAALPVRGDVLYRDALRTTVVYNTGNDSLDKALEGGVLSGEVLEVCGPSAVGKTTLCLGMAVKHAAKGRRVLYIDTACSLQPSAVMETCSKVGVEPSQEMLRRLEVSRPDDVWSAISSLDALPGTAALPKLLVVDAVTAFMLPAFGASRDQGVGTIFELSRVVRQLASKHNVVVLLVMHLQDRLSNTDMARMWQRVPHLRVELQKGHRQTTFRITKATRLPLSFDATPLQL